MNKGLCFLCSLFLTIYDCFCHLDPMTGMVCMTTASNLKFVSTPIVPDLDCPTIAIIGLGRVGSVLGRALHSAGYSVVAVASRDHAKAEALAHTFAAHPVSPAEAAAYADLVLLTVPDDALPVLVHNLAAAGAWRTRQFVVHASGASPAGVLQPAAKHGAVTGSFHPVAAFASPHATLPLGITFGVEAPQPLHQILVDMAHALGGYALPITAEQKTLYHAAAVIASNYTVTLAAQAAQLFDQLGASPEDALRALLPLMRTTLDNLEQLRVPDALTGPLARGDAGTVARHLQALDRNAPHVATFYRCLGQATLPLALQRGLDHLMAGALQDLLTLPSELVDQWEES
jgi:predicted short-subunit dehydrogenase-like oxidoreductase (DUF2520 family)